MTGPVGFFSPRVGLSVHGAWKLSNQATGSPGRSAPLARGRHGSRYLTPTQRRRIDGAQTWRPWGPGPGQNRPGS
eukprot:14107758-Alexandrium_andersonii.AAC.1